MKKRLFGLLAFAGAIVAPVSTTHADDFEAQFDRTFGTEVRAPRTFSTLEERLAALTSPENGRIGVAAIDLASGRTVAVLGEQPFPMASTSKIAVAATFLEGVERGRWQLDDAFPLMVPLPSARLSSPVAPVRAGSMRTGRQLIEMALIYSSNEATDALLAVVGGPQAVNGWLSRAGLSGIRIDRDIATLVRDDGVVDPATTVDRRDSTTPTAMIRLLSGLYRGQWLSDSSRAVIIDAMERCQTGRRRIPAMLPEGARVAHKTGTLNNTSSDVGIIHTPDGRAMAVAIYVTGQGGKPGREARIATIARAIYDDYQAQSPGARANASR